MLLPPKYEDAVKQPVPRSESTANPPPAYSEM